MLRIYLYLGWGYVPVHSTAKLLLLFYMEQSLNLPSDLRHVANHVILSPILDSPVSDLSTPHFLKKLKTHLLSFPFLLRLYSPIGYLRTDISGIGQKK